MNECREWNALCTQPDPRLSSAKSIEIFSPWSIRMKYSHAFGLTHTHTTFIVHFVPSSACGWRRDNFRRKLNIIAGKRDESCSSSSRSQCPRRFITHHPKRVTFGYVRHRSFDFRLERFIHLFTNWRKILLMSWLTVGASPHSQC